MRTLFVRKLGNVQRVPDRSPAASPNESNKKEKTSSAKKKRKNKSNSTPSPPAEETTGKGAPVTTLIETCVDNGAAVSMNGDTGKTGNLGKSDSARKSDNPGKSGSAGKSVSFSIAADSPASSNTTATTTTSSISTYKLDDDLESNYKIENYITAEQIDDMIDRRVKRAGEGTLKKTAAIYDLNLITNVSHNVIVDPETGQVESIVRQEYDTPTTPQSFYISSPTVSLEIIQEEDDIDIGRQSMSTQSTSTQTELCGRNDLLPAASNLSVRSGSDSISNYSEIGAPGATGFYNRYREMLMAEHNEPPPAVTKSRSVPYLGPKIDAIVRRPAGSSATTRPLSVGHHASTEATMSTTASTSLSQYMNSESDSSRPTSYYSSQEEVRRLQELCGLRPANPSPRSSNWSTSSQTSSATYESVPNHWSTSSSSDLYSVPIRQRTNSERSSVSPSSTSSTCHLTTSAGSVSTDWNRFSSRSHYSTTASTTSSDWTDTTSTASRGRGFPLQRSAYSRCINSGWSDTSRPTTTATTTSSTSTVLEEVTNSLDELSRKIEAYIQKRKHPLDSGSDTGTDSTVRYVPDLSATSDGNETDYAMATPRSRQPAGGVPTLKKLALKTVLSFDSGLDLLSDIYFVPPQKSAHLNRLYTEKGLMQAHRPRYAPRHADSVPHCPRAVLSPSRSVSAGRSVGSPASHPATLLENHQKFVSRRGYFEQPQPPSRVWPPGGRADLAPDDAVAPPPPDSPRSCVLNVDENYTKELLEEAANLLAVRKYRETRSTAELRSAVELRSTNAVRERRTAALESVQVPQQRHRLQREQQRRQRQCIDEFDQRGNNAPAGGRTKINAASSSTTTPPPPSPSPPPPPSSSSTSEAQAAAAAVTAAVAATTTPSVAALLARQRPEKRAKSLPADYDQDLRQRMYTEYMRKVAERIERRHKKQIRICSRPLSVPNMIKIFDDSGDGDCGEEGGDAAATTKVTSLEAEFMQRARTRLEKLGIRLEELESGAEEADAGGDVGGRGLLPGHLQEMIEIIDREEQDDEGEFVEGC